MSAFEVIEVIHEKFSCDGGGGPLGHPKVYLHIDHAEGDRVTCPYCSREYVLKHPRIGIS